MQKSTVGGVSQNRKRNPHHHHWNQTPPKYSSCEWCRAAIPSELSLKLIHLDRKINYVTSWGNYSANNTFDFFPLLNPSQFEVFHFFFAQTKLPMWDDDVELLVWARKTNQLLGKKNKKSNKPFYFHSWDEYYMKKSIMGDFQFIATL